MPTTGPRSTVLALGLLALLARSAPADPPEENRRRLAAMPLERRQTLARNLERLDALPADEQARLRQLDQQLAECEPTDRRRYLAVAHRYHLWLQTLTDDQRQALAAASPQERIVLVKRYRADQRQAVETHPSLDWVQLTRLTAPDLERTARQLKVWFHLDRADRDAVAALRDPAERTARLDELGKANGALREFRRDHQALAAQLDAGRTELDAELLRRKPAGSPALKKRGEAGQPRLKAEVARHRLKDLLIVRQFEPAKVDPAHLGRFEAELPAWVRESLDPLPPDAAWRRLHILYRLVFPPGQEIAPPSPAARPGPPAPTPTPPSPPSGPTVRPF
jgi:hypothetical protein